MIKVEIISKETIKPSSPNPNEDQSLLNHLSSPTQAPLLLFYSSNGTTTNPHNLKKSLFEKTLTRSFFPFPGITITDHGIVYIEAKVNCFLSDFLQHNTDSSSLKPLLPTESITSSNSLLLVQSTFFNCGGVAIGACCSSSAVNLCHKSSVIKRCIFNAENITALQSITATEIVKQPTREEVLTALIWKCAMNASRSNSGHPKLSVLSKSVYTGKNLGGYFAAQKDESDTIEMHGLVREIRNGREQFSRGDDSTFDAIAESFVSHDVEFYVCNDLCGSELYDVDLGLGKPIWVTTIPSGNVVELIETREGDGIEAVVSLSEEDMALFEGDKELLAYSSLNSSVLNSATESGLLLKSSL